MRNLAGHVSADRIVALELSEAGVQLLVDQNQNGEVPTILYGRIPGFTFTRAWYYWVVRGEVPLETAKRLYDHPIGRSDVRVAGHCGCPPPEDPWVTYTASNGKRIHVLNENDRELFNKYDRGQLSAIMGRHMERVRRDNVFVDTKRERDELTVRAYVDTYHIDSQKGLRLFVEEVT